MADHDHICTDGIDINQCGCLHGCGVVFALAAASVPAIAADSPQPGNLSTLLDDLPKNWGRWGDEDELGVLNLLGVSRPSRVLTAMQRDKNRTEQFPLQLSITSDESRDPLFVGRFPARKNNTLDARLGRDSQDGHQPDSQHDSQ